MSDILEGVLRLFYLLAFSLVTIFKIDWLSGDLHLKDIQKYGFLIMR